MPGPGKIIRPTSGGNAPRNMNTSGRGNQPFRYVRPMGSRLLDEDPVNCTTRYFNSSGTELWHKNHGATVRDVSIDSSGNVYEVGDASGVITLRKRNSSGVLLWTANHGATLRRCVVAPDGGVVAGGDAGTGDYTLRKWSSTGTLEWSATTAAQVISIAVDSLGAVAALESLAGTPWDSLVYAFAPDGTAGETQSFGASSGSTTITPKAISFSAANGIGYTATFAEQIDVAKDYEGYLPDVSWQFSRQEGFGSVTGASATSGGLSPGRVREMIGDLRTPSPPVVFVVYTATSSGAFGYNGNTGSGSGLAYNHYDIGPNTNANCMAADNTGAAFVGSTSFAKYPFRTPGTYWTTSEWSHDHHGQVWGCDALDSGNSVMGGAVSTI